MGGNGFFALLSRMRYIARWGLMRSSIPADIQQPSHPTAVYAPALGLIRREVFHRPCDAEHLAVLALYHDAPETLTGDLPTPVKYHDPRMREAYGAVEQYAGEKLMAMLPAELRSAYRGILTPGAGEEEELWRLVKAADKLSAYIKCLEEVKAGNSEFREAAQQTRQALEGYDLPELRYFMETFLESFSLSLDQLK